MKCHLDSLRLVRRQALVGLQLGNRFHAQNLCCIVELVQSQWFRYLQGLRFVRRQALTACQPEAPIAQIQRLHRRLFGHLRLRNQGLGFAGRLLASSSARVQRLHQRLL